MKEQVLRFQSVVDFIADQFNKNFSDVYRNSNMLVITQEEVECLVNFNSYDLDQITIEFSGTSVNIYIKDFIKDGVYKQSIIKELIQDISDNLKYERKKLVESRDRLSKQESILSSFKEKLGLDVFKPCGISWEAEINGLTIRVTSEAKISVYLNKSIFSSNEIDDVIKIINLLR